MSFKLTAQGDEFEVKKESPAETPGYGYKDS
jgi:hypothetical protein